MACTWTWTLSRPHRCHLHKVFSSTSVWIHLVFTAHILVCTLWASTQSMHHVFLIFLVNAIYKFYLPTTHATRLKYKTNGGKHKVKETTSLTMKYGGIWIILHIKTKCMLSNIAQMVTCTAMGYLSTVIEMSVKVWMCVYVFVCVLYSICTLHVALHWCCEHLHHPSCRIYQPF